MTNKQQVINYIMSLTNDFTMIEVAEALSQDRNCVYSAIERLVVEKKAFHVGYKRSEIHKNHLYSLTEREFNKTPVGAPKSEKDCTADVMLWLEGDFILNDIAEWLNVSTSTAHNAKDILVNEGLLFRVLQIRGQNSCTYAYSTVEREEEIRTDENVVKQRARGKIQKRRQKKKEPRVYHPVDPLKGFIMPMAVNR